MRLLRFGMRVWAKSCDFCALVCEFGTKSCDFCALACEFGPRHVTLVLWHASLAPSHATLVLWYASLAPSHATFALWHASLSQVMRLLRFGMRVWMGRAQLSLAPLGSNAHIVEIGYCRVLLLTLTKNRISCVRPCLSY